MAKAAAPKKEKESPAPEETQPTENPATGSDETVETVASEIKISDPPPSPASSDPLDQQIADLEEKIAKIDEGWMKGRLNDKEYMEFKTPVQAKCEELKREKLLKELA